MAGMWCLCVSLETEPHTPWETDCPFLESLLGIICWKIVTERCKCRGLWYDWALHVHVCAMYKLHNCTQWPRLDQCVYMYAYVLWERCKLHRCIYMNIYTSILYIGEVLRDHTCNNFKAYDKPAWKNEHAKVCMLTEPCGLFSMKLIAFTHLTDFVIHMYDKVLKLHFPQVPICLLILSALHITIRTPSW
jgi:hypothetical protein